MLLFGKPLDPNKIFVKALTSVDGIGDSKAIYIAKMLGINPKCRVADLERLNCFEKAATEQQIQQLVSNTLDAELIRERNDNITCLKRIRC